MTHEIGSTLTSNRREHQFKRLERKTQRETFSPRRGKRSREGAAFQAQCSQIGREIVPSLAKLSRLHTSQITCPDLAGRTVCKRQDNDSNSEPNLLLALFSCPTGATMEISRRALL